MPVINPNLVPLVTPGNLFDVLTTNNTLAIRFLTPTDPHYYEVYNRPDADIALRQLIIAKSVDQLGLRISHQNNFPFLISCTVNIGTGVLSLPLSWIWDMHIVIKDDWENLRLARLQRMAGGVDTSGTHTGVIRFVFTANMVGSTSEVGIFFVDYQIDSALEYQIKTINPATVAEYSTPLPSDQTASIAGFVVFRTLDTSEYSDFFTALAPPTNVSSGARNTYEITNTQSGGTAVTEDFSLAGMSHGTGLVVPSSYNVVPPIGTDEMSILTSLNYPWQKDATMVSNDGLTTIPSGLFSEFSMTAPMGNRSDTSEENYPVYLTRIRRLDASSDSIQLFFSTYDTIIGSSSNVLIEFASLILERSDIGTGVDKVIEIIPYNNLRNNNDVESELFSQNFGSGYVKLSSYWSTDASIVTFFNSFLSIVDDPADRVFDTQLSDFSLQRSPMQIATLGESAAMAGSTSRRETPILPSNDNRFVTEQDQGLGDEVNFASLTDFTPNEGIDDTAYKSTLTRASFVLIVDSSNPDNFDYETDILPRIRYLLGRDPRHGDEWFEGVTFKRYDGISNAWIG